MAEVNKFFPSLPVEENTAFPAAPQPGQGNRPPLSEPFKADIAERYSLRDGKDYAQVKQEIDTYGTSSITRAKDAGNIANRTLDQALAEKVDAPALIDMFTYTQQIHKDIIEAAETSDVAEAVYSDPARDLKNLPILEREALMDKVIADEFNAAIPDNSFLGSAVDFGGMLAREATFGIFENITQAKKTRGETLRRDINGAIREGKTLDQIRTEIIRPAVEEARTLGLFNNNAFNMHYAQFGAIQGGQGLDEQAMALLDVATVGPGAAVKVFKGGAAAKALSRVKFVRDSIDLNATLKGMEAADAALTHSLVNQTTGAQLARHTAPAANRIAAPAQLGSVSPSVQPVLFYEAQNSYRGQFLSTYWGRFVSEEVVKKAADDYAKDLAKNGNASYLNHKLDVDQLDNRLISVRLGKDSGEMFINQSSAQKMADSVGGTVKEESGKFYVQVDRQLPLKDLVQATGENELAVGAIRNILSPDVTSSARLLGTLKQGEARIGTILDTIGRTHRKAMKAISKKELRSLDEILVDLQNSGRSQAYRIGEFRQVYNAKTGRPPSDKVVKAYISQMQLNDVKWLINADREFKKLNDFGAVMVKFKGNAEMRLIPDDVRRVSGGMPVYDPTTGKFIRSEELLKTGQRIYSVTDDFIVNGRTVRFVTGEVENTRPLSHHDAFNYNPGGIRDTRATHFARQVQRRLDEFGNSTRKIQDVETPLYRAPILPYAARSEKEAAKAVNEINQILDAIVASANADLRTMGRLPADWVKGAVGASTANLDTLISRLNNFNPDIETLDDFLKMMDDTNMDFTPLEVVRADASMNVSGLMNKSLSESTSHADLYRYYNNTSTTRYKTMVPKGTNELIVDPTKAIERDFSKAVSYMSQRAYIKGAIEGFVKGADPYIVNKDQLEKLSIYERIQRAQVDTSTEAGRKFAQEQKVILRRLDEKTAVTKAWERKVSDVQAMILDNGFGEWTFMDKFKSDPIIALRGVAFDMKLGMLNIDQLVVQSSQALNIIAISPLYGLQASLDMPAMRMILLNGSEGVIGTLAKRSAKLTGQSAEDFVQMATYMKKSGRLTVGDSMAEIGAMEGLVSGRIEEFRKATRIFFNEGEKNVRMIAMNVAWREFKADMKAKGIKVNIDDPEMFKMADDFITRRADTLTANMTGASAAAWQKGLLSIPTQWLSYFSRNMEQIFLGRELTRWERAKLAGAQFVYFGATAVGAGQAVDWYMDDKPEGVDPETYTAYRWGVLDYFIEQATGSSTAFAERLSPFASIVELFEKWNEDTFVEVIAGPVGQIVYETGGQFIQLGKSIFSGNPSLATLDGLKLLKHLSGFNRAHQAYWMINAGEFYARNGRYVTDNMTAVDAFFYTIGAQLQPVVLSYDAIDVTKADDTFVNEMANKERELKKALLYALEQGNDADVTDISNLIQTLRIGLNTRQLDRLMSMKTDLDTQLAEAMVVKYRKYGFDNRAEILRRKTIGE